MTITANQILQIIPAGECSELKKARTAKQVEIQHPIASAFACRVSEMLRSASRTRCVKMIRAFIAAGIQEIDNWSLDELLNGRLNPETGVRRLPNGKVNRRRARRDVSQGVYYGAVPKAPVTKLHQTGVIWNQV